MRSSCIKHESSSATVIIRSLLIFLLFLFPVGKRCTISSVRKVELHMKYIRLTQMLEFKAREYQEVCAREKSLISRMTK